MVGGRTWTGILVRKGAELKDERKERHHEEGMDYVRIQHGLRRMNWKREMMVYD
jgi:hypothetical protein